MRRQRKNSSFYDFELRRRSFWPRSRSHRRSKKKTLVGLALKRLLRKLPPRRPRFRSTTTQKTFLISPIIFRAEKNAFIHRAKTNRGNKSACNDFFSRVKVVVVYRLGHPRPPRFTSESIGYRAHTYNVTWVTDSFAPISEYRLIYRRSDVSVLVLSYLFHHKHNSTITFARETGTKRFVHDKLIFVHQRSKDLRQKNVFLFILIYSAVSPCFLSLLDVTN